MFRDLGVGLEAGMFVEDCLDVLMVTALAERDIDVTWTGLERLVM